MREDSEFFLEGNEDLQAIVKRYEAMVKSNRVGYFDVHEYEKMVDHYLLENRSEDAINVLRMAKKQHPNASGLTLKKAEIELESGLLSDALSDLSSVEAIEKNNPDFYLVKAKAVLASGNAAEAKQLFDVAISKTDDDKLQLIFEVVALFEDFDQFEIASEYLKAAEAMDENNSQIYGEQGFIYEKLNKTEDAIAAYTKMLDLDPFLPFGWSNLGTLYSKLGKNDKAIEAFDYAIALEPDASLSYFSKANALANNADFGEALKVFFEYAELEMDSSMALCCIGECYEKLGDFEKSAEYYRRTLETDPDNPDAIYGLAVVELENDNIDKSFELAKRAIELDAKIPEYWFGMGKLLLRYEKYEEAKAAFTNAVTLDPLDFESWLHLSEIEADQCIDAGIEVIKRSLKENADVAPLHYRLAAYYFIKGDEAGSLEEFEKAVKMDSVDVEEFFEICPEVVDDPRYISILKKYIDS